MQAAQRSAVGVAKDVAWGQLSAAVIATGTSLVLSTTSIGGTFVASGSVTVYDGSLTETKAVSAFTGGNTLTVAALTNPHPAGCLVTISAANDAPTDYLPVTSLTPADNITQLQDQNYRGAMADVYDLVEGPISGSFDLAGDFIADPFGYILGALFGDCTTTGGSAPFSHVFAALNTGNGQPKSMTIADIEPVQARAYPRMLPTDLSIMFDATKQLSWTAKFLGFNSGVMPQPTKSFTTDRIVPSWTGSTTVGGVFTPTLKSGQIDFKRNGQIIDTNDGNQQPYNVWLGPISASGKLTFVYEDESQLLNYLNNTQPSLVLDFITGAGAALRELKIQMSRCAYSTGAKTRNGDLIDMDIAFVDVSNTTDVGASGGYSPAKVTLQSSKASGTYV